jgi:hypothetical protein
MEGDDLHRDITQDCNIDKQFEHLDHETYLKNCKNYVRSVWNYSINEKGKKVYGNIQSRTNLLYFDSDTLMTTPMDHDSLIQILEESEK